MPQDTASFWSKTYLKAAYTLSARLVTPMDNFHGMGDVRPFQHLDLDVAFRLRRQKLSAPGPELQNQRFCWTPERTPAGQFSQAAHFEQQFHHVDSGSHASVPGFMSQITCHLGGMSSALQS